MSDTDSLSPEAYLEQEYAHRGLLFTSPFRGLEPVQAYGCIDDGKRFYFRLRGSTASLTIGRYDRAVEEAKARQLNNRLSDALGGEAVFTPTEEGDLELYPSVVEYEVKAKTRGRDLAELFTSLLGTASPPVTGRQP